MDILSWQSTRLRSVESTLDAALTNKPDATQRNIMPQRLLESMRYSTLSAGKRIRALLTYAAGEALGANTDVIHYTAAAVECIHAYSLIHDDLPAMDNDDLRRGKPTNHLAFDHATAILAGDALQTLAFALIAQRESGLDDRQCRKITMELALASGGAGMVGGQLLDMQATNVKINLAELKEIHSKKTGALIRASVLCGAYCANNVDPKFIDALDRYATSLGLAFQVVDDILDVTSDTDTLGKTAGADQELNKATYPSLLGLAESKLLAKNLLQESMESIEMIGDNTEPLRYIAERIVTRTY